MVQKKCISIIGGGASGIFAAIRAAELIRDNSLNMEVHVFESAQNHLGKVKISGGGRCNVTNNQFDTKEFIKNYPRGGKELLGPFSTFQAKDTVAWFENKGVHITSEADGRMFPSTNKSETIINCFLEACEKAGVLFHTSIKVEEILKLDDARFKIVFTNKKEFITDKVLIATGSAKVGHNIAKSFGHNITKRAPSLFSFVINHRLIKEFSGISFKNVIATLHLGKKKKITETGPLLITHWGLSGPTILKLSAFGAIELQDLNYNTGLIINWAGTKDSEYVRQSLLTIKDRNKKNQIKNCPFEGFSKKFWTNFIYCLHIDSEKRCSELSNKEINKLVEKLIRTEFQIEDKNRFKDEFVECGGVKLSEINFKTMGSKIVPNLFFTGEILNIDGITGGFNFQNAWTTGYIAGTNIVK